MMTRMMILIGCFLVMTSEYEDKICEECQEYYENATLEFKRIIVIAFFIKDFSSMT